MRLFSFFDFQLLSQTDGIDAAEKAVEVRGRPPFARKSEGWGTQNVLADQKGAPPAVVGVDRRRATVNRSDIAFRVVLLLHACFLSLLEFHHGRN